MFNTTVGCAQNIVLEQTATDLRLFDADIAFIIDTLCYLASLYLVYLCTMLTISKYIGNKSVPVQLAQWLFPGLAIFSAKI